MKNLIYALLAVLIVACSSDSNDGSASKNPDNFNRKEMLTFWADSMIIPAYTEFAAKTKTMNDAVTTFANSPTLANLTSAKVAWKNAYISWQKVSLYQVGKASELNMTGSMNTYPTSVSEIEQYIVNQNYNFDSPNLLDAQGFPALDYLLYGKGSDQETVNFYANTSNANTAKYLKEVSARIKDLTNQVLNDWKGEYRNKFVNNDGYTTASSVDVLVNFYIIPFFEKQFREFKLVIPAGARTGTPVPTAVEAYYAKNISKELYIATLNLTKDFFQGKGFNGKQGKSLQQYLEFLNRADLATDINEKFKTLTTLSNSLDDSFMISITKTTNAEGKVTIVINEPEKRTKMLNTFDAILAVLKKFKPDMMSAMSVMNTSTDTDND